MAVLRPCKGNLHCAQHLVYGTAVICLVWHQSAQWRAVSWAYLYRRHQVGGVPRAPGRLVADWFTKRRAGSGGTEGTGNATRPSSAGVDARGGSDSGSGGSGQVGRRGSGRVELKVVEALGAVEAVDLVKGSTAAKAGAEARRRRHAGTGTARR